MTTLNRELKEKLELAGWQEGRRIDLQAVRKTFNDEGVILHSMAESVLAEFYGVCVVTTHGLFEFKPEAAFTFLERDDAQFLERLCGPDLVPVGAGMRLLMFVSPRPDFVFMFDEWDYYRRFPTLESALEFVVFLKGSDKEPVSIPDSMRPWGYLGGDSAG